MNIYLQWLIGCALLAIFFWLAYLNFGVFWKRHVLKKRASSWIPLLGGCFGVIAFFTIPIAALHDLWWIPLFLDWGSLPGITYSILFHLLSQKK